MTQIYISSRSLREQLDGSMASRHLRTAVVSGAELLTDGCFT